MEKGLLSQKGRGRGNGVMEKQSFVVDDPGGSNDRGNTVVGNSDNVYLNVEQQSGTSPRAEKTFDYGNNNDTHEGNVLINVTNLTATPNNYDMMLSRPTSYAKLVTGEPSRKNECPKNIVSDVEKNLKNPIHAAKGVHVGTKSDGKAPNCDVFPTEYGFFDVASSSTCTTPIVERIDKIEKQIIDGKVTLVDGDRKP
ncbi:hypothetical protein Tco_1407930 [Tanacetum coccineum]